MSAPVLYSGPGQVVIGYQGGSYGLQGEGENGKIEAKFLEKRTRRSTAFFGYQKSTLDDQQGSISLTPFDSWSLGPCLLPPYLGVTWTAASSAAALLIGTRPHDYYAGTGGTPTQNALSPATVYTTDGRLYSYVRAAVTKHPGMKFGNGLPLWTAMEIGCLGDPSKAVGASAYLMPASYPVAGPNDGGAAAASNNVSSGTIPAYGIPDYISGHWTGAWGSVTGFTALDSETGWELMVDAKYSPLLVQKRTYHMKLDSVEFVIKARLTGETHTQLAGKILAHTLGGVLTEGSATNLVLTGPGSKTVTLNDCEVFMEGSGFEFGGTGLGTGDVAFVTELDFTSGAPTAGLVFS